MNGVHGLGGDRGEPESPGPPEWRPPLPCGPTAVMWERELRFAELPIIQEKLEICILRCNALIFKILANHLKNVRQAIPLCGTKDRTEGLLLWAFYPLQPPHWGSWQTWKCRHPLGCGLIGQLLVGLGRSQ